MDTLAHYAKKPSIRAMHGKRQAPHGAIWEETQGAVMGLFVSPWGLSVYLTRRIPLADIAGAMFARI